MTKQGEDLAIKHLHVDALDSAESTREGLLEVVDAEEVTLSLESSANSRRAFVVLRLHLITFEGIIKVTLLNLTAILIIDTVSVALSAAATIVTGHTEEARAETLAKARGNDLVHVEAKHRK